MRSCRFQPTARSAAMRAPQESIALIVPNAASPTMKYSGAEMPVCAKSCTCRLGLAIRKYRSSGNPSDRMKNRRLRSVRSSS